MASSIQGSSANPKVNPRDEYYPLWRHVEKLQRCGGGGSWEWRRTLCNNSYKGSYPRVKTHILQGGGQGIASCMITSDPMARMEYQREQDHADGIKRKHDDFSQAKNPANIEPRDRKSTRLNSSHLTASRMPSSA